MCLAFSRTWGRGRHLRALATVHKGAGLGAKFTYYEFFAGAGMARAGLGHNWECLFANDHDDLKQACYAANWADKVFDKRDVALIRAGDLPGFVDLAWASFPCQDLSQAGAKMGIGDAGGREATRSGAVWPFLDIIRNLAREGRHPVLLALENVVGLLNANGGADFRALCAALGDAGYRFGAVVADASHFVPQSRPRVFVVAVRREVPLPSELHGELPQDPWHTQILLRARVGLSKVEAANWVWWTPGNPPSKRNVSLSDVIDVSKDADWNTNAETKRLVGMMAEPQLSRLAQARAAGCTMIGSLYLRMRPDGHGGNVQRAEISFGETLGCLRTPKGGASRPRIVVVDGKNVCTRLVTAREAASLMGLDKNFNLPETYHESFRLIGDGVVPAVVRFLAKRLLEPLAAHSQAFVSWPKDRKVSA